MVNQSIKRSSWLVKITKHTHCNYVLNFFQTPDHHQAVVMLCSSGPLHPQVPDGAPPILLGHRYRHNRSSILEAVQFFCGESTQSVQPGLQSTRDLDSLQTMWSTACRQIQAAPTCLWRVAGCRRRPCAEAACVPPPCGTGPDAAPCRTGWASGRRQWE